MASMSYTATAPTDGDGTTDVPITSTDSSMFMSPSRRTLEDRSSSDSMTEHNVGSTGPSALIINRASARGATSPIRLSEEPPASLEPFATRQRDEGYGP